MINASKINRYNCNSAELDQSVICLHTLIAIYLSKLCSLTRFLSTFPVLVPTPRTPPVTTS